MTNIQEMEKMYNLFEPDILNDDITKKFMGCCINSLKDLHEENCKLWKAIAELQVGDMQKFHDKIYENNLEQKGVEYR